MNELNDLFRKRIGFPENKEISFEALDEVLRKTSIAIPFENLCLFNENSSRITPETLGEKILKRNEGGLCYELNPLLYLFLKENGFSVCLIKGVVFDQAAGDWGSIGKTHVAILLTHQNKQYIVDTGFGGNIPLKPVPLDGSTVTSANGQFRIERENPDTFILSIKLKHKHTDWQKGYAFYPNAPINTFKELDEIQETIKNNPLSPFNKAPLLTRRSEKGSLILTKSSLTEWEDGGNVRKEIDEDAFRELVKKHFLIEFDPIR